MGLFGNKLELKKEFFETCLNMSKIEVLNYREKLGFKVNVCKSFKKILVISSVGGFLRNIEINDYFWDNGERAYKITIRDFTNIEVTNFLNNNFIKKGVDWILIDGSKIQLCIGENNRLLSCSVGNASYYDY